MTAIVTLYLSICATDVRVIIKTVEPQPQTPQQLMACIPLPLRNNMLWYWLAVILKNPLPALETTPQLLVAFFETAGSELVKSYGTKQVMKVVMAMKRQGLEGPPGGEGLLAPKAIAARQQLKLIIEPFLTTGKFEVRPGKVWETEPTV